MNLPDSRGSPDGFTVWLMYGPSTTAPAEWIELRMSISEVIGVARKFLRDDAGYERVTVASAVAIEPDSKWKVIAEISGVSPEKKEIIVDDKDGKVVSYKQA